MPSVILFSSSLMSLLYLLFHFHLLMSQVSDFFPFLQGAHSSNAVINHLKMLMFSHSTIYKISDTANKTDTTNKLIMYNILNK